MKYREEELASDLFLALKATFKSSETDISISGSGVHWHCAVERANSHCHISCFASLGEEYCTTFSRNSTQEATSRIPHRDQTIAAVRDWLAGQALPTLYDQYPFVDRIKRALSRIRDAAMSFVPELQMSAESGLQHRGGDSYQLLFSANDRSCKLSFFGKNELPDARFYWDGGKLFEFQPRDNKRFSMILERWICDSAMPSTLRAEFPGLHIGELADYYERGQAVEGDFIRSWKSIKRHYKPERWLFSNAVLVMIEEMRSAGYDRQLRAGQSLSSLGLSRSRRKRRLENQPQIWFQFRKQTMTVRPTFDAPSLEDRPILFTPEIRRLLDLLVRYEVYEEEELGK